jgi:glycosyltransferase involved in cell wall biosynthesis
MPRLLIVTTVPASFPFFLPFADHFRSAGWKVDALTGSLDGFSWRERFDHVHVVPWSRDPLAVRSLARAAKGVRAVVAEGGHDVVHVHTPVASFVTRFALRRRDREAGPQVVYTAHGFHFHRGGRPGRNAVFLALEKLAARWTDWLVVINREDEAAARRWRLMPEERIRWMPGIGVDLRRYSPETVDPAAVRRVREELGLGREPAVLMVAEFVPGKRHADLVRAVAALCREPGGPRPRLLLAGRGPLAAAVLREAGALGIGDRVHALGLRADVPVLMRAAQVLALPSDREGLPRCVLEAMSMGLPVVATRVRGSAELLEGGCGTLVEVGDVAGLAAGLRRMLTEPGVAGEVAGRARERVAAHDERVVIRLHEELYADALASRSGALRSRAPAAPSVRKLPSPPRAASGRAPPATGTPRPRSAVRPPG